SSAADTGYRGDDPPRHPAERQGLQPDLSRAAQRREEEPFAAEERGLDAADHLNVVVHGRLQGDDAARVDPDELARRERALVDRPAGMNEGETVPFEPLHDEAFAAEEAPAELLL